MANIGLDVVVNDKTAAALGKINNRVKGLDKSMAGINNRGKLLVATLTGIAAGSVVKSIVSTTARFEDLRTSLSSVTGSAKEGAEAFDFISRFSTKTQFGIEELSQTFIKLKASGIEPTEKLLTTFTDTAAVTTDQLGSLTAITDLLSRTTSGGLGLEELNRLADRGIPVFKILEERLGLTRLQISEFGKTAEGARKITEALLSGLDESFGGATQARVNNLSTRISNFQIALANASDTLGQGLNEALGETIVEITELIESNDELIKQFGEDLGDAIRKAVGFAKELKGPLQDIGDIIDSIITGFMSLPDFVKSVGLIGAILFGKKGFAALAGISFVIGEITKSVEKFNERTEQAAAQAAGNVSAQLEGVRSEISRLQKEIATAELNIDIGNQDDISIIDPTQNIDHKIKMLNALLEDEIRLEKLLAIEVENKAAVMRMAEQDAADYEARQASLNAVIDAQTNKTLTNTEAIKGAGVGIDNLAEMYEKMIVQSDNLISSTTRQLTPLQQAQKKYKDIEKQLQHSERALVDLNGAFETDEKLIEQIKQQIPELTSALGILEEQMMDLAAMESPFFEFGQHIKEQGDAIKQLGNLSTQVYDRMAQDLTNFVMTGKFNFASFSRFVIQELIKIAVQAAITFAIKSIAGSFGIPIPGLAQGGPARAGQPYIVGEQGPELFVPNQSGTVVPNGQTTTTTAQDGMGDVYVNFNINTVDATGFDELLVSRRSTIVGIINEGLNRQGKRALI